MKLYVCFLVGMLAIAAPSHALLGAKLALLGALKNGFGGFGNGGGGGGGYGSGFNGGYGTGYSNGGYGGNSLSYNRPVYTGLSSNYGWGQQSYGGGYGAGYSGGYNSGYNGGNDGSVKVIKVIVNREQPESYYDNYARSSASAVSSSSGFGVPAPIPQTYSVQPVQSIHVSGPAPAPVQIPVQVQAPALATPPVQVIQPPPRSVYIQSQLQPQYYERSQPAYQQIAIQRPIQYPVQQPQPILRQTHVPAASYGPPAPAPSFVAPTEDNSSAWSSDSWNNAGNSQWKKGGIWESIGC